MTTQNEQRLIEIKQVLNYKRYNSQAELIQLLIEKEKLQAMAPKKTMCDVERRESMLDMMYN